MSTIIFNGSQIKKIRPKITEITLLRLYRFSRHSQGFTSLSWKLKGKLKNYRNLITFFTRNLTAEVDDRSNISDRKAVYRRKYKRNKRHHTCLGVVKPIHSSEYNI